MKQRYAPPPPSQPQVHLGRIPKGYLGTNKTVQHMQVLIRAGVKDFYVRQKAIDILLARGVKPKDYLGEIKTLFEWVQGNIRYTKDPFRLEVLHSPRRMLELRAGDCDDMSILLGTMLEAIGHPVRLILTGPDPSRPRLFTHVYLEVFHKGRWLPLDPTMPHPMGWSPRTFVKKVIPIERKSKMRFGDMSNDMELQGLEAIGPAPDWLRGLLRAVRGGALQPKDERVKQLWELLRQRQLLGQSPWLQAALRRIWQQGLAARPRPRTTRRLIRLLRRWTVLPPAAAASSGARRPRRRRSLRPLAQGRLRPVRPVIARPVSATTTQPAPSAAGQG